MSQSQERNNAKIMLTNDEYENFRAVAEKYNVDFNVKTLKNMQEVEAPRDKLLQWGYLEDEEPDE